MMSDPPPARWSGVLFTICACWFNAAAVAAAKDARLEDRGPPPPNLPFEPLTSRPKCLPCEDLFSELQEVEGGFVQRVEMTERGAPKSGTGGMFEWAVGAMYHTCQYLNQHYGRDSCFVEWGWWGPGDYYGNHTLIFEPPQEQPRDAPCTCSLVRRVTIALSKIDKHILPVEETCPYAHGAGYQLYLNFCQETDGVEEGSEANGNHPLNFDKVWRCMQRAGCRVNDDRKQMVIFRDPRAAAVSSFFFLKAGGYVPEDVDIDSFIAQNFPVFCKWLVIRLSLFARMFTKDKVAFFWYNRWQNTPLKWHRDLFQAVGLRLPESVALASSRAALTDDFPFFSKGRDAHLGVVHPPTGSHTYRDDVSAETARSMDETMRRWLPPKFVVQLHPGENQFLGDYGRRR